jgi:hypothetical protein
VQGNGDVLAINGTELGYSAGLARTVARTLTVEEESTVSSRTGDG